MMKKYIIIFTLFSLTLLLGSCGGDEPIFSGLYFSETPYGPSQTYFSGYNCYQMMTVATSKPITVTAKLYYQGVLIDTRTDSILSSDIYSTPVSFTNAGTYSVDILYNGQIKLSGSFVSI